jgi:hypothetical protein
MSVHTVQSAAQRLTRYQLTDDEIALSFSIHFTWGYPDYMREAFNYLLKSVDTYAKVNPDKDLPWAILRIIFEEADSTQVRMVLAGRPTTAAPILNFLATSADLRVVQRVAENPSTHVATLTRLVRHHSSAIRMAVSEHPSTPEVLLQILARDEDADLRFALAENYNMPRAVLETLEQDENPYIAARASRTLAELTPSTAQVVTANFRSTLRRIDRLSR